MCFFLVFVSDSTESACEATDFFAEDDSPIDNPDGKFVATSSPCHVEHLEIQSNLS